MMRMANTPTSDRTATVYDGPRLPPMRIEPVSALPQISTDNTAQKVMPMLSVSISPKHAPQARQLFEHVEKQRKQQRKLSPPVESRSRRSSTPAISKMNPSRSSVRPLFVPMMAVPQHHHVNSIPQGIPQSMPHTLPQGMQIPPVSQVQSPPSVQNYQPVQGVQNVQNVQGVQNIQNVQGLQNVPGMNNMTGVPYSMPINTLYSISPPSEQVMIPEGGMMHQVPMNVQRHHSNPHTGMHTPPIGMRPHEHAHILNDMRNVMPSYPQNQTQPPLQQMYEMSVMVPGMDMRQSPHAGWSNQMYQQVQQVSSPQVPGTPVHVPQQEHQVMNAKSQSPAMMVPATQAVWDNNYSSQAPHSAAASQTYTFTQDIKRRTKTGCLTCRKRRVKCDEQHPLCRNCQKSERVCLGYDSLFHSDRMYGFQEQTNRRRDFRNARKKKLASRNGTTVPAEPKSEEKDVLLSNWLDIAKTFKQRLAKPFDQLLGTDQFSKLSFRCVEFLTVSPDHLVTVAGEAEAMHQLLATVFPHTVSLGLSILDSTTALEKLRTSVDYYFLRAIAESLFLGTETPAFKEKFPNSFPRNVDSVKQLDMLHKRARTMGLIVHNQLPARNSVVIRKETFDALMYTAEHDNARFTTLMWDLVEQIASGCDVERERYIDISKIISGAVDDPRFMLILLALESIQYSPAKDALQTIEPNGLSDTIFEISMLCRQKTA